MDVPPIDTTGSANSIRGCGGAFERLVFAYHVRAGQQARLEWLGQDPGSDQGRDVLGSEIIEAVSPAKRSFNA